MAETFELERHDAMRERAPDAQLFLGCEIGWESAEEVHNGVNV